MKKIAIVLFDITKRAGTERAVCNLANMLAESGKYEVSIISIHSKFGEAAYEINKNVSLYHLELPIFNRCVRLKLYYLVIKSVNRICYDNHIDIVLGTTHAINIVLILLKKQLKTVGCEHMNYKATPLTSRILRRLAYPFLDAVVILTTFDANHYSFHKNVKVIPNTLSFTSEKKSELTNKVILAIGRITRQKGFDLLVNTMSLIKDECNGWEIKIFGSGEDENNLRKQIKMLYLENLVKIYPPTESIVQEYLNSSIFVLSSRWEGLPMVIIEAQSCGLPIVSFDCPGPADIINHEIDGFLVESGNVKALSKAIVELILNYEKRKMFGKKALENSNKYKPENVFHLWDILFKKI